jgi:hypothetical protein
MEEEWKQSFVPLWEVSSLGRVRNKKRNQVIKPYIHNGYYAVGATAAKTGRQKVHRLVCFAFHGEPSYFGLCVDHIDGNKLNNCATNLQWLEFMANSKKNCLPENSRVRGELASNSPQ